MAALQLTGSSFASRSRAASAPLPQCEGLRASQFGVSTSLGRPDAGLSWAPFRRLVVKAATVVTPRYTSVKPLGDRVLVKIKSSEEKTVGGILLPSTESKPQGGEVIAVGRGRTIGERKVKLSVKAGSQVVYSKYAGTEIELNGSSHLLMKEEDIVGVLDSDDVMDLKPLNDRVLIKIMEAEEKTAGGVLLTESTKGKAFYWDNHCGWSWFPG